MANESTRVIEVGRENGIASSEEIRLYTRIANSEIVPLPGGLRVRLFRPEPFAAIHLLGQRRELLNRVLELSRDATR